MCYCTGESAIEEHTHTHKRSKLDWAGKSLFAICVHLCFINLWKKGLPLFTRSLSRSPTRTFEDHKIVGQWFLIQNQSPIRLIKCIAFARLHWLPPCEKKNMDLFTVLVV